MQSVHRVVMDSGLLVLLFAARCFSQTTAVPAAVVQITPSAVTSSTPLPPALPSTSPYFSGFRSIYPQQYFGGPIVPQQYIGGPTAIPPQYIGGPTAIPPQYIGGPTSIPPQFIGGPNVAQRFINAPTPYVGQFVPILQQTFDITPEGSYTFSYQSADGSQRQESGGLKYPSVPGYPPVMSVQGSYSAITHEGVPIEVSYIADENGYQPSGPGIHPSIQRAIAQQVAQAKQEQLQLQPKLIK